MNTDALPKDLLEQAQMLLTREPKRPKQASLRRAISTSYYAVFHLLGAETARVVAPNVSIAVRNRIRRFLDHGEMKIVCGAFSKPLTNNPYRDLLSGNIEADLQTVAANFIALQDARHEADYDLGVAYTRVQAALLVKQAEDCFAAWGRIRKEPDTNVFLLTLLMRKRWDSPRP